jgi:fluoroacetyl-CoA thioesterase
MTVRRRAMISAVGETDDPVMFEAGLAAETTFCVTAADTAAALGSGDVDALATPRLIAWCEHATMLAIEGHVPIDSTSVGVRIELDHVAATGVGGTVTIRAELSVVEGRLLTFSVQAHDERAWVGSGTVVRSIVNRDRFVARLRSP